MFRYFSTNSFSRYTRFSLRGGFLALTLSCIAFGTWWRWPVQVDRVPKELGQVPEKFYECGNSLWQTALWSEEAPPRSDGDKIADPFGNDRFERGGGPVFVVSGKCWARRDWQVGWILEGPAEVFAKDNKRVIRAEFASGKLHGEFCSWFTSGQVRETGRYYRGQKDGVWELCEQFTGKVKSHEEYDRGRKVGIWTTGNRRDHYRDGKLDFSEMRAASYSRYPWTLREYDDQQRLKRVTYWNDQRDVQLGVDLYKADRRHGSWYRVRFEDQHPIVHRGQWLNGLPYGEWVYEREHGLPQRLEFRQGALATIDGEPAPDLVMQKFAQLSELSGVREELLEASDREFSYYERSNFLRFMASYTWPPLRVDPRLSCTQTEFDRIWEEWLPADFDYDNLPAAAAICLGLRGTNLTIDFRLGTFWLSTPELAATWQDQTGTREWFRSITEAVEVKITGSDGYPEWVGGPYDQRQKHFGEDWKEVWEETKQFEFLAPLVCHLGTARRIDASGGSDVLPLELPESMVDDNLRDLSFDERIALECELRQCRLVLRGETLVLEPQ